MVNLWELLNLNFKNIFVDFFFGNFIRAQSTSRLFPITHSPYFPPIPDISSPVADE